MRVADYIAQVVKSLEAPVFLLAGGNMMHLMDGLYVQEVPYTCCHHESTAGLAAIGYAKACNNKKIGVCYATNGPGATNLLTAISEAYVDSTPVLFIVGQCRTDNSLQHANIAGLRQVGISEVDVVRMAAAVTKYCIRITRADNVIDTIHEAIHRATSGRPGPVLIEIPLDVQAADIKYMHEPRKISVFHQIIPNDTLDRILTEFHQAQRPVLLLGKGAQHLEEELKELLLACLNIPVVTTCIAKDVIPYNHDQFIGHVGMKADRAGNHAIQNADVILSLGQSFHTTTIGWEPSKFAPNATIIQVDIDSANLIHAKNLGVSDIQVSADINHFVKALIIRTEHQRFDAPEWLEECQYKKITYPMIKEEHKLNTISYNVYEVMDILSQTIPENAIVITDSGSAYYAAGQGFLTKEGQIFISSTGLGAMGHAIPMAIGAAKTNRPVFVIVGDGSFYMSIRDLISLKDQNVTIIILNNDGYLSIKNTQKNLLDGHFLGCDRFSGVYLPLNLEILESLISFYSYYLDKQHLLLNFKHNEKILKIIEAQCLRDQDIIRTENV